jgi:hypothetical protein
MQEIVGHPGSLYLIGSLHWRIELTCSVKQIFFRDIGFLLDGDQVLQELSVRWHLLDGIQERDVDLHLFEHLQNVLELSSFLGREKSVRLRRLRYKRPRRNLNSGSGARWLCIFLLCAPASLSFLCSRVLFRKNYLVIHLSP